MFIPEARYNRGMRNIRPLLLAALAIICAVGLVHGVKAFHAADTPDEVASSGGAPTKLFDAQPPRAACEFWTPWKKLVAPGDPKSYLERIKQRLDEPSARSGEYKKMIERARGVLTGSSEKVCISGRVGADGAYHLDAEDASQCSTLPAGFLETNLQIGVEEADGGGYINDIEVAVGMDHVRPEGVLTFFQEQSRLMRTGYNGWTGAFPAYRKVNEAGFGLTGFQLAADGQARLTYLWLNQAMMSFFPGWAEYLFKLSDLATVQTTFLGANGQMLYQSRLDTAQSGLDVIVPPAAQAYLDRPEAMELTVTHDIIVRFRGLVITLKDLRFTGRFAPDPGNMVYDGRFVGVGNVELSGAYRGLSGGSFGKMIYEMVQEKIREEINRLTQGNKGNGWIFRLSHETKGAGNVFIYKTTLQSPVNFLNLVREDKDTTESPVLPTKPGLAQLNRLTLKSVDALIQDLSIQPCPVQ